MRSGDSSRTQARLNSGLLDWPPQQHPPWGSLQVTLLPCPALPALQFAWHRPTAHCPAGRQAGRQARLAPYYTPGRTGPAGCSSGASVFSPWHKRLFVDGKSACPGHPSRVLLHHQLRPSACCNSQPFATSSLVSKLKLLELLSQQGEILPALRGHP